VEAAGIEPASLEPLAQTYYKLSRYYVLCSAGYRRTAYAKVGDTLFILDISPFLVFSPAIDAPAP
jgi:hypothetical protein